MKIKKVDEINEKGRTELFGNDRKPSNVISRQDQDFYDYYTHKKFRGMSKYELNSEVFKLAQKKDEIGILAQFCLQIERESIAADDYIVNTVDSLSKELNVELGMVNDLRKEVKQGIELDDVSVSDVRELKESLSNKIHSEIKEGLFFKNKIDMNWVNSVKDLIETKYKKCIIKTDYSKLKDVYDQVSIVIETHICIVEVNFILEKPSNILKSPDFNISIWYWFGNINENRYKYSQKSLYRSKNFTKNYKNEIDKSSILSTIGDLIKEREANSKISDFFKRLSENDVEDLFLEISDIVGSKAKITKIEKNSGFYNFLFENIEIFDREGLLIEPDNKYLELITELNNINSRLDHFGAVLRFYIKTSPVDLRSIQIQMVIMNKKE